MEGLEAGIGIVDNTIVRNRRGLGRGKGGDGVNGDMGGRGIWGIGGMDGRGKGGGGNIVGTIWGRNGGGGEAGSRNIGDVRKGG